MHTFGSRRLPALVSLALTAFMTLPHAFAQSPGNAATSEAHLEISAGDVFEIMGMKNNPEEQFDWVLTQNGEFVEAGRETIFRTRFTQPGTYTLDGQFRAQSGNPRLHMEIKVRERDENDIKENPPPEGIGLEIVSVSIPVGESGVQIPPESPLLTLTPSVALAGPISADLDTDTDSDGDGVTGNDNDTADTLFATEHNALHLWYAIAENASPMHLQTTADDGTVLEQTINIVGGEPPVPGGSIAGSPEQEGVVHFSFAPDTGVSPASVITHWDFGDGYQSLLEEPRHRYLQNGQYTVHVIVREMSTGRVLAEDKREITINSIPQTAGSSSSVSSLPSSAPATPTGRTETGVGSIVWTLFKILVVLLLAIGLGALAVWGVRKFLYHPGSLQKALELAEGKLLKKDTGSPAATPDTAPATMKLKRPEPPSEKPAEKTEESIEQAIETTKDTETAAPPAPAPAVTEAAAPAWLQKGLEAAKDTPPQPAAPDASSAAPFEPGPPALPTETTPTPEPAPSEDDMLPPWLKEEGEEGKEGGEGKDGKEEPALPSVDSPLPPPPAELPVAPAPEPLPEPATVAPAPAPTPPPPPAPISTAAPQAVSLPAEDAERLERERERKRRKRQRYRENLKKRKEEAVQIDAPAAPPALAAPTVTAQLPAPTPPPPPKAPTAKPVAQDIPPAEPSKTAPSTSSSDDNIAFVIKAEGVTKPKNGNGKKKPAKGEKRT